MNTSKVDLTPDAVTTQHTRATPDEVALIGYLGEGRVEGFVYLYETVALERWIEIAREDIVGRVSASGSEDGRKGRSVIWVRRDAIVVRSDSLRASCFEPGESINPAWPRP